ncbi:sensor histidine kinase [Aquimarina sp. 2201CG5-10]|uniref:sensor histidine kinase n=1 Tax=Aquimarina callyspongiae TaxID=3098150 RepID=UPI002AB5DA06|nr:histidine kinase [Aquimarina sp. 2201CG5-10]MDY8136143.1 histidine kinase [Aquimarina sp. 2201CG5-10]
MKKTFQIKEIWIHVISWVCLLSLPIGIILTQVETIHIGKILQIFVNPIVFYANYSLLAPKLLLKKKIVTYIVSSIAFLVILNTIIHNIEFFNPVEEIENFKPFRNGLPQGRGARYVFRSVFSFAFFLLGGIFCLIVDFYKRDKVSKETEAQRTETELQFLKAQLNPHFLFNSLNSVYSLVRNKSNDAPEAVLTLSELMRYMLYEANQEIVPLIKEIDYIKNYVSLQRLRLSNSEDVTICIKGDYEKKNIYPLLLISFIENAFKYGTDFKGVTDIDIRIEVEKNTLHFMVSNIIGVYRKNKNSSGVGLSNIKNRLELLYQDMYTLDIREENGRYVVNLTLILEGTLVSEV